MASDSEPRKFFWCPRGPRSHISRNKKHQHRCLRWHVDWWVISWRISQDP